MPTLANIDLAITQSTVYFGIGTVVLLVGGAIAAATKVVLVLTGIQYELKETNRAVNELKNAVNGSYSKADATEDFQRMALANPTLLIPRPDKAGAFFENPQQRGRKVTDT